MKKLLIIFLIFSLIFCSLNVSAKADISDWAREHFDYFEALGVNISTSDSGNYTDAITRLQFAQIIYDSYTAYTGEDVSIEDFCPFSDTDAPAANAMYILDIAKGDENGNFNPDKNLSRQEAAKMLCNYYIMLKETELSPAVPKAYLYDDYEQIAPWAVNFISSVASASIMSGREPFVFAPLENLTIEEATVLLSRAMQYNGELKEEQLYQGPTLSGGETSAVSWNDLPDSEKYYVKIKEY
ncbi:MAG: S-layer homology domain-containing protein, partial [Clostridia bacterium]|nr:S-layer homology domain-containing protein [Clostridia bacterium]